MRLPILIASLVALAGAAFAQTAPVDIPARIAANTRTFSYASGFLSGPGADHMLSQLKAAQFVLLGERHFDHETPVFAKTLFSHLRGDRGFRYLAVEQDPLAMTTINAGPYRGNVVRIAALARRYPAHIGFASDQDLEFLAFASAAAKPGDPVVWGLEQAQGATRYLEMLTSQAPNAALRTRLQTLLEEARTKETRANQGGFLHDDPTVLPRLLALKADIAGRSDGQTARLLSGLVTSAEIYSYNRRANAGERVGLYNNTEREALFKRTFMEQYRAANRTGMQPKVMFKFGSWHVYRGRSPGGAYTIANFAHEFAIANGHEAYGIDVIPIGDGYATLTADEPWMTLLFPGGPPTSPTIIDLRPLRPYARLIASPAPADQQAELRDYIHAHDAVVVLPHSRRATWDLTGFPAPG